MNSRTFSKQQEEHPSYSQIQRSLQVIRKVVPQIFDDQLINYIFEKANNYNRAKPLINKILIKPEQRRIQPIKQIKPVKKRSQNRLVQSQVRKIKAVQTTQQEPFNKQFMNFKKSNKEESHVQNFYKMMKTRLGQVYNQLQTCAFNNNKLIGVSEGQKQKIVQILSQNYKKLSSKMWNSICKIVSNQVNNTNYQIEPEQMLQLYQGIHNLVQQYQANPELIALQGMKKGNDFDDNEELNEKTSKRKTKYQLHKVWKMQYQSLLLKLYKQSNQFSYIRDTFKYKYPQIQHLFTRQSLRSKIFKLVRVAIKKLFYQIQHFHHNRSPALIKLDDNRIKSIMYNKTGRDIKVQLLELYASKNYDPKLVTKTILCVNQYINTFQCNHFAKQHQCYQPSQHQHQKQELNIKQAIKNKINEKVNDPNLYFEDQQKSQASEVQPQQKQKLQVKRKNHYNKILNWIDTQYQ